MTIPSTNQGLLPFPMVLGSSSTGAPDHQYLTSTNRQPISTKGSGTSKQPCQTAMHYSFAPSVSRQTPAANLGAANLHHPGVDVVPHPGGAGLCLRTTRPFAEGECIIREQPIAHFPTSLIGIFRAFAALPASSQEAVLSLHANPTLQFRASTGQRSLTLEGFAEMLQGNGCTLGPEELARAYRGVRAVAANACRSSLQAETLRVFKTISRINHSCLPNARRVESPEGFEILARRAVAEGEEVTFDYAQCSVGCPAPKRAAALQAWGFTCGCPVCSREEDYFRGFRCPSDGCTEIVWARTSVAWSPLQVCACAAGHIFSAANASSVEQAEARVRETLGWLEAHADKPEASEHALAEYQVAVQGGLAPGRHWGLAALQEAAAVACWKHGQPASAAQCNDFVAFREWCLALGCPHKVPQGLPQ